MYELFFSLLISALSLFPQYGSQGIQQLQHWRAAGGNIQLASTTAPIRVPFLASCDTIDTDANGVMSCGTDGGGGGGMASYDAWSHAAAAQSATTSRLIDASGRTFSNGPTIVVSTTTATGDTTSIVTALSMLPSTGGSIELTCGTFALGTGLLFDKSNVVIKGQGRCTNLTFDGTTVPTAVRMNDSTQRFNIVMQDVLISNVGAAGNGVCVDFTDFTLSRFVRVDCGSAKIGYQASTTDTHYNSIIDPRISVSGAGSYFIYLSSGVQAAPISNIITNPRGVGDASTIGYYINAHHTTCLSCHSETSPAIGMVVGEFADDSTLDVYLEQNTINLQFEGNPQGASITGFIADADTTNIAGIELAQGVDIRARVQYLPMRAYLTGQAATKYGMGIGTTTNKFPLSISATATQQLSLWDGEGINGWTFRNAGGTFNLATASPSTYATSSLSAFSINVNGFPAFPSLASCDTIDTNASGVLACGTDGGGSGGSFPFTATTNYGQGVYATSTPTLWFQSGLFASSTSMFSQASTTLLEASSRFYLGSGGIIDFNNGDILLTHSTDLLALSGGTLRTNDIQLTTGSGVRTGTTGGNTTLFQARDTGAGSYTTMATLTAGNPPTFNASTTLLTASYASSTLYYGAGLADCHTGNMLTWTAGRFGCEDDSTSAGAANPFTWASTFGALNAATSSNLWAQGVFNASSTVNFGASAGKTFTWDSANGRVGIATTSPGWALSVVGTTSANGLTVPVTPAASPTFHPHGSPGNGLFFSGATSLGYGIAGTEILVMSAAGLRNDQQFISNYSAQDATNPGYGFLGESLGMFRAAANTLGFSAGGVQSLTIRATGASTTDFTIANVVKVPYETIGFTYSTTSWGGTTTILLGPAAGLQTFDSASCETTTGMVGVSLYDGTNRANYIPTASTTINTNAYSSNNTFTKNESRRVDIGTPASSPVKIACTLKFRYIDDQ